MHIAAGPNVDVIGDAHHLSRFLNGHFDFVFFIAVFEHPLIPWKVAIEMNKVMTKGGLACAGRWPRLPTPAMANTPACRYGCRSCSH